MPAPTLEMAAPADVYRTRRRKLATALTRPLLIPAGRLRARNYVGNDYPYRPSSTYRYFGGPPAEGAAWLIEPGSDGDNGCHLARPVAGPDDAVWFGESPGDDALAAAAGLAKSHLIAPDDLPALVSNNNVAVINVPCHLTIEWLATMDVHAAGPEELLPIIDMRLIHDAHELAAIRTAAKVAVEAHTAAWRSTASGRREAVVAGAFHNVLVSHQCLPSFTPIATVHGEVLHCLGYGNEMKKGDLLLVDGGAEEPTGYASDVTRVAPVGGEFSTIQRLLYDTVHRAQRAAVAQCIPGKRFRDIHDLAARVICEGLVDANLLRGRPDDLVQRKAHTLFFVHGLGHLFGQDVHDMEDFGDLAGYAPGRTRRTGFGDKSLRLDRDLVPGMTVTIEPGIYLIPAVWQRDDLVRPLADCVNRTAVDALLSAEFGGIRLEDDIHVTAAGPPENLTEALPMDADAVADLVNSA